MEELSAEANPCPLASGSSTFLEESSPVAEETPSGWVFRVYEKAKGRSPALLFSLRADFELDAADWVKGIECNICEIQLSELSQEIGELCTMQNALLKQANDTPQPDRAFLTSPHPSSPFPLSSPPHPSPPIPLQSLSVLLHFYPPSLPPAYMTAVATFCVLHGMITWLTRRRISSFRRPYT